MFNSIYKNAKGAVPALLLCMFILIPAAALADEEEKKTGIPAELKALKFANDVRDPNIYMAGYLSYTIDEYYEELGLQVQQVANANGSGTSGTLRLFLYASHDYYYEGDPLSGYILGSYELGPLPAGTAFNDIDVVVDYDPPPYGAYWIVLMLTEEDIYGDNVITDHLVFSDREVIGWGGGSGSGDSGGGGCFIESIRRKAQTPRVLTQTGQIERLLK